MVKSNFFEILRTLKKSDLKSFEELVKSPYYNKNSNVIKLFKYVKKFYPEFNNEKLKKEIVWDGVFKGRKFNYGIMKNLIYELNKLTEKFLQLQEYEKNEFEAGLNLIYQLRQRNLNTRFERAINTYKDVTSNSKIGINYYYYYNLVEELEQFYNFEYYKTKAGNYAKTDNINTSLFSHFFSAYFYQNYNALAMRNFFKVERDTKDLEVMLKFFEKNKFEKSILAMLYYYGIKLLLNPKDEALYYEMKKIFLLHLDKFDRATKYNIGAVLSNFCSGFKMDGIRRFDAEMFEILKLTLKHNFYSKYESDYLDPHIFSNIIGLAVYFKQISWCHKFINEYYEKLNPADKYNHYYFGMHALYSAENNLDESLKCLSKIKPKNVMEKIALKREEIKIYYDLKYFIEIYPLIKTCKEYTKHDKDSSDISLSGFVHYLEFVKKLVDININQSSEKYDKRYFEELKTDISEKRFISKTWVLNRLQKLEESAVKLNLKIPA